ncbi:hypothetical protein [Actinacidiphila epipremni]|uniref:Uncharacterized protein n=1 Tax=Actinacidiphila epipremni TaxID=2053013 RepID=A0ABX0ZU36_9ACTN|nr:hypothetical protein [Actinacidiphila epipremni]NJP47425.1 hypothetical protein [Actinacidiphila epipremni]
MSYPVALALTVATEVPVYTAALAAAAGSPPLRTAGVAVMVNLVTHPPLWWFLRHVPGGAYWPAFAAAEAAVLLVEGALLARALRLRGPAPYAASAAANAVSVLAGFLLL